MWHRITDSTARGQPVEHSRVLVQLLHALGSISFDLSCHGDHTYYATLCKESQRSAILLQLMGVVTIMEKEKLSCGLSDFHWGGWRLTAFNPFSDNQAVHITNFPFLNISLFLTWRSSNAANNSPARSTPLKTSDHSKCGGNAGFSYRSWLIFTTGFANARPMNSDFPWNTVSKLKLQQDLEIYMKLLWINMEK